MALVTLVVVLIGAYHLCLHNYVNMESILSEVIRVVNNSVSNCSQLKELVDCAVEKLDASAKVAGQANTISFLFTVFSIALVSAGAYLLERTRKNLIEVQKANQENVTKTQKAYQEVTEFIRNHTIVLHVSDYFSSGKGAKIMYRVHLIFKR